MKKEASNQETVTEEEQKSVEAFDNEWVEEEILEMLPKQIMKEEKKSKIKFSYDDSELG